MRRGEGQQPVKISSPEEFIAAIAEISVKVCKYRRKPKATFCNSTRFEDGWSPMFVAKLAALNAITTMRQHITGSCHRALWWRADDIDMGINEVTREWDNKLRESGRTSFENFNRITRSNTKKRITLAKGPTIGG